MNAGNAWRDAASGEVRGADVACESFRSRHSDYVDGELAAPQRVLHERHLAECGACARYARVLARGTQVLRELPELEPSAEFEARLQHRLFHLQDERVLGVRRPVAGWLALAAVLGTVVVGGRLLERTSGEAAPLPAAEPFAAHPHEDVFSNRAEVWEPVAVPIALAGAQRVLRNGAYTPVVVRPPQFRTSPRGAAVGD